MDKNQILINVDNVSKSFKTDAGVVPVLHNISFAIPKGSFTVIYGPSGSGKSTLLNILIGLDAPTSGKVSYSDKDLYLLSKDKLAWFRAHSMGMVQQTNSWVKSLNVLDNVALPAYFLGKSSPEALATAKDALRKVGMETHAYKNPTVLSGGEQQRAAMARAIVNSPFYVAADEPTGNLDTKNGDDLILMLRNLNKKLGRTIVLVTHNLEYLSIGDQLIFMEDGRATEIKGKAIKDTTTRLFSDMKKHVESWAKNAK